MEKIIIQDQDFKEKMKNLVEPYLAIRKSELWPEREPERKIHCVKYHADNPKAVVMISHGYTETAEKYKEIIYYFLKGILIYTSEKRKYLSSLSDIHEIVSNEPIKKEAKKRKRQES